jgi:hypothetical protein
LFLRKRLALYQERLAKPKRPDPATRIALVLLARLLDWRSVLTVVQTHATLCLLRLRPWNFRKSKGGYRDPVSVIAVSVELHSYGRTEDFLSAALAPRSMFASA